MGIDEAREYGLVARIDGLSTNKLLHQVIGRGQGHNLTLIDCQRAIIKNVISIIHRHNYAATDQNIDGRLMLLASFHLSHPFTV